MKVFLRVFLVLAIAALGFASPGFSAFIIYNANLSGPNEDPPNASPGTGTSLVTYDDVAHTLHVEATFSGLIGTTTVAHIHAPTAVPFTGTAGVATTTPTFPGFPSGVTSGTYDQIFDLTLASSFNPAYVTGNGSVAAAEEALVAALAAGKAYLNIHTSEFGGGEIRGFLVAPLPASLLLFGTGLAGLAGMRFRKNKY